MGPVRSLVFGLADPRQALEAGLMGLDAAIVLVAPEGAETDVSEDAYVDPETAVQIARALPPLSVKLAWLAPGIELPPGFTGVVTPLAAPRPSNALVRIVRAGSARVEPVLVPPDADAIWLEPGSGAATTTRYDFGHVAWLGHHVRTIVEVPEGVDAIEPIVRLGKPYGVLFGSALRFRPGILDLDRLEQALATVARLNKASFS